MGEEVEDADVGGVGVEVWEVSLVAAGVVGFFGGPELGEDGGCFGGGEDVGDDGPAFFEKVVSCCFEGCDIRC